MSGHLGPLTIAAFAACLVAGAVAAFARGASAGRPRIVDVRAVLLADQRTDPRRASAAGTHRSTDRVNPVTAALARRIAQHRHKNRAGAGSTSNDSGPFDLDPLTVASRCLTAAAIGFITVVFVVSALVATGSLPFHPVWGLVALAAGIGAAIVMWSDASATTERQRRAFQRATNDFIQLVAVGLTTDQSVEQAIEFALGVGDSEMFDLIRSEIATAPLRGLPVWEALDHLGVRTDRRELCELAASIERQGTQGVSITSTVTSLAEAMRARALDELERDADRANANLAGPTIAFVVTTVVFLAYPLAVRINDAFGG